jgi:hypothetical protein
MFDVAGDPLRRRILEACLGIGAQAWLVGLHRQQVVGAGRGNGGCDRAIGVDGVDRDQRAAQSILLAQPGQQGGDGSQLVGPLGHRLLTEHQTAGRSEGGDQVEASLASRAVVAAARGLAVDDDELWSIGPSLAEWSARPD